MATTDTRTGFRLPWSSDQDRPADERHHDDSEMIGADASDQGRSDHEAGETVATAEQDPNEPAQADHDIAAADHDIAAAGPTRRTGRPSKFLAELTRAMQTAAETARESAIGQLQADAKTFIEQVHTDSATEATELRRQADDDVASIREWSKAEIARIRDETEQRVTDRKAALDGQIEDHAARIERRIERVQTRVAAFEAEMATFFERLLGEEDPSTFASLAGNLPEPPPFDLLDEESTADHEVEAIEAEAIEAEAGQAEAVESGPTDGWAESDPATEPNDQDPTGTDTIEAGRSTEIDPWTGRPVDAGQPDGSSDQSTGHPHDATADAGTGNRADAELPDPRLAVLGFGYDFAAAEAEAAAAAGEADPHGTGDQTGDPIEPMGDDFLARRLSGLAPDSHDGETTADPGTAGAIGPTSTRVVVVGLVSVASIAGFKRHLARLAGVTSVGVSSGPDGEFIFAVGHEPAVNLRDSVPAIQGFQARISDAGDGFLNVIAHDPETEA